MADIFISYSKVDHELALELSAFFEAEGWTVWWDKSLKAADSYRDEIMQELAKARAVITIWTENSIKSDWVRAEAGRAKADGKLIPLKATGVAYGDIPLPFGEMHTENVAATELIRSAVVAQLAKPAVTPSAFHTSLKTLRYQLLTWGGIIGGTMSVFGNLKGVLNLADWANRLVTHWHDWTRAFWDWVFALIGIQIPQEFVPPLSFVTFVVMLSIGLWMREVIIANHDDFYQHHVRHPLTVFIIGIGIWMLSVAIFRVAIIYGFFDFSDFSFNRNSVLLLGYFCLFPIAYVVVNSSDRLKILTSVFLCIALCAALNFSPLAKIDQAYGVGDNRLALTAMRYTIIFFPIVLMGILIFAPISPLTKRLGFIAIGLIILTSLNEISKLDLGPFRQLRSSSYLSKHMSGLPLTSAKYALDEVSS